MLDTNQKTVWEKHIESQYIEFLRYLIKGGNQRKSELIKYKTEVYSGHPFFNQKLCDKEIKDAEKLFLVAFPYNLSDKVPPAQTTKKTTTN